AGNTTLPLTTTGAISTLNTGLFKAGALVLQAGTGIGTSAGAPLQTQASNLVAKTTTGGVFISNSGNLTLGFTNNPFQGVTGSGDLSLVTTNGGLLTVGQNITDTSVGGGNTLTLTGAGGVLITSSATLSNSNAMPLNLTITGTGSSAGAGIGVNL